MSERIVVITGATGGLGPSIVEAFRRNGDRTVTVARSGADLAADLTDPVQAAETVNKVLAQHGRFDVLAHAMGGFTGGQVAETENGAWDRMMSINYKAAVYVIRNVIPIMTAAGRGRIVAVSSRTGVEPAAGTGAYGASKAALNALVRTVALEVKDRGVTANAVLPGTIRTPANLSWGRPEEVAGWVEPKAVAAAILWLASEEAAEVNGALLPVYGRS